MGTRLNAKHASTGRGFSTHILGVKQQGQDRYYETTDSEG